MKVAVVGAGVFGAVTAVDLARAGHHVDLYDRHPGLLYGASRANQGRLHAGYHYPRSPATAKACQAGSIEFAARFPKAIVRGNRHHYLIAAEGSLTGPGEYLRFCDDLGLPYTETTSPLTVGRAVAACLHVREALIDLPALRAILWTELRHAGVQVHLNTEADPSGMPNVDWTVNATYGRASTRPLRYEVCENALIRLGPQYAGRSFLVFDGPFFCLDPVPGTGLHMLYDVQHSVHHTAATATAPEHLAPLLDQGPVFTRASNVDAMLATARRFLKGIGMPEYRGSYFTTRAVLPDVDDSDARPTLVEREGDVITVLGGKIDTAVSAARQVAALIRQATPVPAA